MTGASLIASGRVPKTNNVFNVGILILPVTEGDPAFGQIVGRKFEGYFVARQYANAIPAKAAREVRKHHAFMFQLHAE